MTKVGKTQRIIEVDGKLYRVGPEGMKGSKTYLGPAPTKEKDKSLAEQINFGKKKGGLVGHNRLY